MTKHPTFKHDEEAERVIETIQKIWTHHILIGSLVSALNLNFNCCHLTMESLISVTSWFGVARMACSLKKSPAALSWRHSGGYT